MIWFVADPGRLERERVAVASLMEEVDWLHDVDWGMTEKGQITLNFAVVIGDRRFALKMTYPRLFPFTPPDVAPVGEDRRLSSHQYGDASGDFCLQYRPDNWLPTLMGADMVRSAHALLATEWPADGPPRKVESAHRLTTGQEFRQNRARLLVPGDIDSLLSRFAEGDRTKIEIRLSYRNPSTLASIAKVAFANGSEWEADNVAKIGAVYPGVMTRVSADDFRAVMDDDDGVLAADVRDRVAEGLGISELADKEILIVTDGDQVSLFWQLKAEARGMMAFSSLKIDNDGPPRLPPGYSTLAGKKVAIVGCGSAGSKIAASLARAGIALFVLIDDDLYLRDNQVRNDLDWRNIGEHKVDGVARRIRSIVPNAKVDKRRIKLTGQESAETAAGALDRVAGCDLIIDATAEPNVFNLLASVVTAEKKPIVWLEVFAGGIGGMVARHLPGLDEPPQIMRNAYNNWCRDQAVPWTGQAVGDYAARVGEKPALVADDADVAVIAAHATRMAIDALLGGDGFPQSMYVVSLKAGWIFNQPFETHPIVAEKRVVEDEAPPDPEERVRGLNFLIHEVLGEVANEDSAA